MSSGSRYCIIPGNFIRQQGATLVHFRVLCMLGTMTDAEGWCFAKQLNIANHYDIAPESVSRAIKKLKDWGYVEQRVVRENGRNIFWYRVKMDQGISDNELKRKMKKRHDPEVKLTGGSSPTCREDQVQHDPDVKSYNKDERPPLTTPSLSNAGGRDFIISELEKKYKRVVDNFLKKTITLQFDTHHDLSFFEMLCQELGKYPDGALKDAASHLIAERVKFPAVKFCISACQVNQHKYFVTIHHTQKDQWEAWKRHYKTGSKYRAIQMENLEIFHIQVPTEYPPMEATQ